MTALQGLFPGDASQIWMVIDSFKETPDSQEPSKEESFSTHVLLYNFKNWAGAGAGERCLLFCVST